MRTPAIMLAIAIAAGSARAEDAVPVIGTDELAARTAGPQAQWTLTIIDVRSRVEYEESHLPGAIHVPAAQAATVLPRLVPDRSRALVFYCGGPLCPKSTKIALAARAAGYRNVFNYAEGMTGWTGSQRPSAGTPLPQVEVPTVQPAELQAALRTDERPFLLDLRDPAEYKAFHLAGAVNIPLDELESRAAELPKTGGVVLACHAGGQSLLGGRLLTKLGLKQVSRLDGGLLNWQRKGLPFESGSVAQKE